MGALRGSAAGSRAAERFRLGGGGETCNCCNLSGHGSTMPQVEPLYGTQVASLAQTQDLGPSQEIDQPPSAAALTVQKRVSAKVTPLHYSSMTPCVIWHNIHDMPYRIKLGSVFH